MKQFRFFANWFIACTTVLLCSCGTGTDKTRETTKDTSQVQKEDTPGKKAEAGTKAMNVVVVKHKIANYAKWKIGYDMHDSSRRAHGLTNYVIARGLANDSNTVLVVLKSADIVKAKEFASSAEVKDAMQKAGVKGPPSIAYEELVWNDDAKIDQTMRLMVTHKVKDFDAWKKQFDDHKQARTDAGLVDRAVAYAAGDKQMVTLVFAVNDMTKAKAFINSKELKDKMTAAGVEGPPSFFFYNIVQMN